jgi:hypothetical protein
MSDVTEREMQAGGLPWPEPISLSVSVMLEGWTDSGAPGPGPMGNPLREGVLDLQARSWAEYGPNRGAEDILRVYPLASATVVRSIRRDTVRGRPGCDRAIAVAFEPV